jgi:hypothetical protein
LRLDSAVDVNKEKARIPAVSNPLELETEKGIDILEKLKKHQQFKWWYIGHLSILGFNLFEL